MLINDFEVSTELKQCFASIWTWDSLFPGIQRAEGFEKPSDKSSETQWLQALPASHKLLSDTVNLVLDGELDKPMVKSWEACRNFDVPTIWQGHDTLKETLSKLKHAFANDASSLAKVKASAAGDAGDGDGESSDDDTGVVLSAPGAASSKAAAAQLQKQVRLEAAEIRNKTIAILIAVLGIGAEELMGLVSRHSLWNAFQGSWKSLHRLIIVDIAHLCEGNLPWKACAGKKAV